MLFFSEWTCVNIIKFVFNKLKYCTIIIVRTVLSYTMKFMIWYFRKITIMQGCVPKNGKRIIRYISVS